MSSFITELEERNLIDNSTVSIDELHSHFDEEKGSVKFYIGFDPTADSLHVGSLQQLVIMDIAKKHGHSPIVLIGGATASIGDPSFRNDMRPIMTKETINDNAAKITSLVTDILGDINVVNNLDWTKDINLLDFLRDFGSLFSVNKMLSFSSVKDRMEREGSGLSVLEFSYSMLQAFDFFHLNEHNGVTVQMGGSDQWANIIQGVELTRKKNSNTVIGITNPLVLKSDGTKMGKTSNGAIWLDKNKTSVFDFFQFWRNLDDSETVILSKRFLNIDHTGDINDLKFKLAISMVEFVHGNVERDNLEKELKSGKASTKKIVSFVENMTVMDVLLSCGLFKSKSEIRRMIKHKEVIMIDGNLITDENSLLFKVAIEDTFFIEKGKKSKVLMEVVQ